jgi:hypothetical protein
VTERWQSVRRITPTAAYVTTGVAWLCVVLKVVIGNVIIRETSAGRLAQQIDRLPPLLAGPVFVLCWGVFFLGWTVLLFLGLKRLLRDNL